MPENVACMITMDSNKLILQFCHSFDPTISKLPWRTLRKFQVMQGQMISCQCSSLVASDGYSSSIDSNSTRVI